MAERIFKLEKEWQIASNTLFLESTIGKYKFSSRPDFVDRIFTLRINDSPRVAIKHEHQIELLKVVLSNDILPQRFVENCDKFLNAIHETKGKRKKLELDKYNVRLESYEKTPEKNKITDGLIKPLHTASQRF